MIIITLTSTCQCFPSAVTTRSSIGRLQAPQMGIPILSWQRRQYSSFWKQHIGLHISLSPLTQPEIRTHYCSITVDLKLPSTYYFTDRIAMDCTIWSSNPGGGKTFLTYPHWPQGPPNLLYKGYQVSFPGISRQGMALTTHSLLVLTFKKEQSYTYTFPLFLHGTLYGDLYLYLPFHWLQTQDDCVLLEPLNWVPHHMLYSWSGSHDKPHLGNAMAYHQSAHWNNQMHSFWIT